MIRVAFCSEDTQHINAHFAQSSVIVIYEFTEHSYQAVSEINFNSLDSREEVKQTNRVGVKASEEDDRVAQRINAVKDCSILYCNQIGGPAAARLIQHEIYPLKAEAETRIDEAADRLHRLLLKSPPRWLQKKL